MVRQWTSDLVIEWKPSLTFSMRRLDLAEWLDEHVEPVALLDEPQRLGVAIKTPDLRVTMNRSGMMVSSGAMGGSLEALTPVLEGVFEILKPKDAVLAGAETLCTEAIEGSDYDTARGRFAVALAASQAVAGYAPKDASGLMDLDAPEHQIQVEWGIVDQDELFERLANPNIGRLGHQGSLRRRPISEDMVRTTWKNDAPAVALLAETQHVRHRGGKVSSAEDVLSKGQELTRAAENITKALHQALWSNGREERELA